jgi:hypothetical protein
MDIDCREICLHSHPPRLQTPNIQLAHPLGNMAIVHLWHNRECVYYRQCNPRLRRSRILSRCPSRYPDGLSADGVHVAL